MTSEFSVKVQNIVGPASLAACDDLLSAAMTRIADRELLALVFSGLPDPDLDAAYVQLDLAGVRR